MELAKVIGTVVATRKIKGIDGLKILMIQPLDDQLKPTRTPLAAVCALSVEAGQDDIVHWVTSRESTLALPETFVPVDAAITGVVDDVTVVDKGILDKNKIWD